ncbi:hypothetical protein [Streptomyces siamensis]|uniref:hypothetical protein n=1 Tax=Streptomyces siamensis TaxID=1274986 RepID=UPI0031EC5CEC
MTVSRNFAAWSESSRQASTNALSRRASSSALQSPGELVAVVNMDACALRRHQATSPGSLQRTGVIDGF